MSNGSAIASGAIARSISGTIAAGATVGATDRAGLGGTRLVAVDGGGAGGGGIAAACMYGGKGEAGTDSTTGAASAT